MTRLTFDESDGEVWFIPCRYDGTLEDGRDPFTGKTVKVPRNGPLTPDERRAVEAVLAPARARMPGVSNMVKVADGGIAELDVEPSSLMLKPRMVRPTVGLATLAYDVLVAGRWCIRADDALVVASLDDARDRPREDERVSAGFYTSIPSGVVLVESPAALAAALGWMSAGAEA